MRSRERMRRWAYALASMCAGTFVVLSTVILINYYANDLEDQRGAVREQIQFERKKPPQQQNVEKPKPKPKPRRTPRNPPAPLTGLNSNLSGVDMGLPGFSADDLSALEGDLLGGADGMVTARIALAVGAVISAGVYIGIVYAVISALVKNFDTTVRKLAGTN